MSASFSAGRSSSVVGFDAFRTEASQVLIPLWPPRGDLEQVPRLQCSALQLHLRRPGVKVHFRGWHVREEGRYQRSVVLYIVTIFLHSFTNFGRISLVKQQKVFSQVSVETPIDG